MIQSRSHVVSVGYQKPGENPSDCFEASRHDQARPSMPRIGYVSSRDGRAMVQ